MDGIHEQLVKKEHSPSDSMKKILVLAAAFILAVIIVMIILASSGSWIILELGIFAAILVMWGGFVLAGNLNIEYEYEVVGSAIQVDKIMNKRSRKTLCEIELRKAKAFTRGERNGDFTIIYACGDGDKYSIEYEDEKYGSAVLIFTPDEKTFAAISPYLPRLS